MDGHAVSAYVMGTRSFLYGSDAEPWVKAKSIFPILSLQGRARLFKHIGKKPIGWFLFQRTNPACERRVIWLEDGWTQTELLYLARLQVYCSGNLFGEF